MGYRCENFSQNAVKIAVLVCCLAFKVIECSRKQRLPASSSGYDKEEEQNKSSKAGKLVPRKLLPKTENITHKDWTYYPFPTFTFIEGHRFGSFDTIHCPSNLGVFSCIEKGQSGKSVLFFRSTAPDKNRSFDIETPLTSVSTFNNYIIFTAGTCFSINCQKYNEPIYSWRPLNLELPETDRLQGDNTITISKLVSETMGYILTKGGLLVCITLVPFSITKVFRNVINFAAENNTLALVTTKKPRALCIFKGNHEKAFFVAKYEKLLRFADKANIVVIDRQYLLLYDKSQTKLVNMKKCHINNIPVGADMMYFEDPWLLALDGTRFTKYDTEGNELQQYNFEAAFRVIPDTRWSSFAIHYSLFLEHDAHIQYVSRRVGQEVDATYLSLEHTLPTVLLQIIYDYIRGFGPDLPRVTSNVIATLTVV